MTENKKKSSVSHNAGFTSCKILGVDIAVTNMQQTVAYIEQNIEELRGNYICVSNVHTTVMAHDDTEYRKVQNSAAIALPDGKPLSVTSRKRGYDRAERVTGPDLMGELFARDNGLRHFFYGAGQETLDILKENLLNKYPGIQIAGMISPPFRPLSEEEDAAMVRAINESRPDIVWIGLGAPKQENWMYRHAGKIDGVMIGVGAGFAYHAGEIKRAPAWMQKLSLEWLYRLLQDPVRLAKRYFTTNLKFLWLVGRENRKTRKK
jgi:N-acetylglucosaminyldiphosphoundecaprenol N-acetyl-beta-D-mannosaminyltransferase